jgi:hypothetical protein
VVIFSEDSGRDVIVSLFTSEGFVISAETVSVRLFERFHLVSLRRPP